MKSIVFSLLLLMSFSTSAMNNEEIVSDDLSSFEAFPDPFEKTPEGLRKIKFDFGNDQNIPEVRESWSVNFDSERTLIIASVSRERPKSKGLELIHVMKDLQTGQLDISAGLRSHDEDNAKSGRSGDLWWFIKPDSATVLKLKQKIAEFEQNEKAKELKHENS